mmetsp:Transcript_24503/g.28178  ORF Transcript_24503/g.28178 Transcript_24503/m.28178 type:complete len:225 (+) Transcript_24503:930-1604(+)
MIKDTTNNHEIITTYPGQGITANSFTSYSFYNTAISDISKYITITIQDDPFKSGIPQVVGYCKGFNISGKYEGVIAIFYNSSLMKNLIEPVAKKSDSVTFVLYQVTSDGDKQLASTDTVNVVEGKGDVKSILKLTTNTTRLVLKDVVLRDGMYMLRESSSMSDSGAAYKSTGINGPYYKEANYTEYDFRAIFLQSNEVLVKFANKMKEDINSEFSLILYLLPIE